MMEQQDQTLDFFNAFAGDWQRKATSETYSVIENRHAAVLKVMEAFGSGASLLDVGCGTGQLAIEASSRGWKALGIDFASEMIALSKSNNSVAEGNAQFECVSVFDLKATSDSFDVISAQGFVEYISLQQFDEFLDLVKPLLTNRGSLVLGSRNRLFNLHTLNEFTEIERQLGTIDRLVEESCILQTSSTQHEALSKLKKLKYEYEQPKSHPITGIGVETRYQFTPGDLITRLARHGLQVVGIYPVHFHALPLSVTDNQGASAIQNYLARFALEHWITLQNLVPYCSSFVIEAKKV